MENNRARLLYMGQASLRIITVEGKVIYIDRLPVTDMRFLLT